MSKPKCPNCGGPGVWNWLNTEVWCLDDCHLKGSAQTTSAKSFFCAPQFWVVDWVDAQRNVMLLGDGQFMTPTHAHPRAAIEDWQRGGFGSNEDLLLCIDVEPGALRQICDIEKNGDEINVLSIEKIGDYELRVATSGKTKKLKLNTKGYGVLP